MSRDERPRRGLFERMMFSVMGPPQVGDVSEPVRELPPRPVDLCPSCGGPRDEHEVVRSPTLTYTVCPGRPDAARSGSGEQGPQAGLGGGEPGA